MNRSQALASKQPRYNTGKPCKHGHYSDRYTQSGACCTCVAINGERIRQEYAAQRVNHTVTFTGTSEQVETMRRVWRLLTNETAALALVPPYLGPGSFDPDKMYPILARTHGHSNALHMIRQRLGHDYVPIVPLLPEMGKLERDALEKGHKDFVRSSQHANRF